MSEPRTDSILAAFAGNVPPIKVSILYRLGMVIAAITMVLLPLVYFGMIVLTAYGVATHAVENTDILSGRGGQLKFLLYLMPIIAGGTLVLFMLKPLVAGAPKQAQPERLEPGDEPRLFAFVARVCRAVGAPRPHAIHLDCQVNASASFWRGMIGMLSGRLVLTIGMPLAAGLSLREFAGVLAHEFGHFAQGGGMRLTYIVRSVNHWFMRVVYERDEWDMRLQAWSEGGHWFTMALFAVTRLFVWLSRRVLWLLMMLGHIISSFMLRQMEHDADRYEASLAGSDAFEATMKRLPLLAVANARAHADLESAWADERLADDLPALVLANLHSMPAKVRREVVKEQGKAKTGLLDSHPADADRIRHTRELAAAGIFQPDAGDSAEPLPAAVLFSDFEALSKVASLAYYRDVLEVDVQDQNLLPTDSIARQESRAEQDQEAVGRFFQNTILPSLPLGIATEQPPAPAQEQGGLKDELARLREELLATGPETRVALEELDRLDDRLVNVAQAHCLVSRGLQIEADAFGLPRADIDYVVSAFEGAKGKIGELKGAVGSSTRIPRRRLELAVAGLDNPSIAALLSGAEQARREVHELWPLLARVERTLPDVQELRVPFEQIRMLVGIMEGGEEFEKLLSAAEPRSRQLVEHLASIREILGDVPYPFEHTTENLLVADYVTGDIPPPDKFEQVLEASYRTITRAWTLYYRLLGRLAGLAEQVESALGLEPLPEPEPDDETSS